MERKRGNNGCSARHYLEFLGLADPDLDLGHITQPRATEQGNLLLFGQVLGILGIQLLVVDAL